MAGVAALLETVGLGVFGQTIFIGAMPDTVAKGYRIWELPGEGNELANIRHSVVQVVAKADDYLTAAEMAEEVYQALILDRSEPAGLEIFSSRPLGQPFTLGREEGSYWQKAVNFKVTWRKV